MMNNIKNNRLIWIVLLMWLCFLAPAHADSKKEGIDVQDIVFSHIQDAYTWHITEWNGKEIAISLPILVKSEERGWDMFLSHHYITAKRITTIISLQKANTPARWWKRTAAEKRCVRSTCR